MTVPREKLIDVALLLAAINATSTREKSIRHGHLSTLQLRWARRQLPVYRAMQFAPDLSWIALPIFANRRSTIQPNSPLKPKQIPIPDRRYRQRLRHTKVN